MEEGRKDSLKRGRGNEGRIEEEDQIMKEKMVDRGCKEGGTIPEREGGRKEGKIEREE